MVNDTYGHRQRPIAPDRGGTPKPACIAPKMAQRTGERPVRFAPFREGSMAIMHIIHSFDANRRSGRPGNRAKRTITLPGSTSL